MLTVEVEYLTGVARAANEFGNAADWPPQPDRLFSALVATWSARGEHDDERAALEWLERAAPPVIEASKASSRRIAKVFVPPNDDAPTSIKVMPDRRKRQERQFPACIPLDPVVRWTWPAAPNDAVAAALDCLARDTSYLGHSTSLVRCTVRRMAASSDTVISRRSVYPGRLAELVRNFELGQRPAPGASVPSVEPIIPGPPTSVFGEEWIVFSHAGGWRPDARAAATVGKTLIKAVQAGFSPDSAPSWVSGHQPDGTPLTSPHLTAIPLLDVGWEWSHGRMMGFALAMPRSFEGSSGAEEEALYRAFARINTRGPGGLEISLRLPGGKEWKLRREALPDIKSLQPDRYVAAASVWATVTPVALDRHPKADGDVESTIAAACERIGLPKPTRVVPGKHTAIRGAPSAWRSGGAPEWADWRLPSPLKGRRLTHAVLQFAEPVIGPVILGAGRFAGLGLCLPLDPSGEK
ncbi:MAG: type I-U CRISPR-associated protein Csb2 [Alphaproteobacteria bacterium]|jgi:CRISPR-associated protein Csb2